MVFGNRGNKSRSVDDPRSYGVRLTLFGPRAAGDHRPSGVIANHG